MPLKRIDIAGWPGVEFEIAKPDGDDLNFVLGVRKCGSSLLNNMVNALAKINQRQFVDVAGTFFKANIPETEWRTSPAVLDMLCAGNVYGGFRSMPLAVAKAPQYLAARKILLVRDPRDALISEYFSTAYTHSLPSATTEASDGARERFLADRVVARASAIADFVLQKAKSMNRTMMDYEQTAADPRTKLFHYEDVILNKRPWLASMAAHFGWDGGAPGFIEGMMGWADKIPTQENPREFVRRVLPGDHKEKLPQTVIEQINATLSPSMTLFGYR
jgi:hypothetical protein